MTKTTRRIGARVALCLLVSAGTRGSAGAQIAYGAPAVLSDTSSVSVSATAREPVTHSRAIVSFQVVTEGESAETAAMTNGEARQRAIEALRQLGYSADQISIWGYGAGPNGARGGYGPPSASGASGFEARSGLRVTVEPLDRLDAVVTSGLLAGATVSTVDFESDQEVAALRAASERAVLQARAQAEAMATAAGGELGDLLSLVTTPDYSTMSAEQRYLYSGPPGSQGVQLLPWVGTVRVTVQATWAFVRR